MINLFQKILSLAEIDRYGSRAATSYGKNLKIVLDGKIASRSLTVGSFWERVGFLGEFFSGASPLLFHSHTAATGRTRRWAESDDGVTIGKLTVRLSDVSLKGFRSVGDAPVLLTFSVRPPPHTDLPRRKGSGHRNKNSIAANVVRHLAQCVVPFEPCPFRSIDASRAL